MPSVFVNHGGGPLPILGQQPRVADFLKSYASTIDVPKAILVVTPHWLTDTVSVSSGATHPLMFDYGGFPPETYKYKYNAPGSPEVAESVCQLLKSNNIPCKKDSKRGWDHGTFVPLMLMYPEANVPVVAMSIQSSLDPEFHLKLGEALRPLRDNGVLIVGSGGSFHNFDYFFAQGEKFAEGVRHSHTWHNFLVESLTGKDSTEASRRQCLKDWSRGPSALACQPRGHEDHLLPLHVVAGAGGSSTCRVLGGSHPKNELASDNFEWK